MDCFVRGSVVTAGTQLFLSCECPALKFSLSFLYNICFLSALGRFVLSESSVLTNQRMVTTCESVIFGISYIQNNEF